MVDQGIAERNQEFIRLLCESYNPERHDSKPGEVLHSLLADSPIDDNPENRNTRRGRFWLRNALGILTDDSCLDAIFGRNLEHGVFHYNLTDPKDIRGAISGEMKWDYIIMDVNSAVGYLRRDIPTGEYDLCGVILGEVQPGTPLVLLVSSESVDYFRSGTMIPFDSVHGLPQTIKEAAAVRDQLLGIRNKRLYRLLLRGEIDAVKEMLRMDSPGSKYGIRNGTLFAEAYRIAEEIRSDDEFNTVYEIAKRAATRVITPRTE